MYRSKPTAGMSRPMLLILFAAFEAAVGIETLEFSLIASFGRFGFNSSGTVPAIDLALEHINQNKVLPGYNLQYGRILDSECNRGTSLNVFFEEVQSEPTKIAVVGCGCSVATEPVAEISHHWNISQISFASPLSTLSDRTRFKNHFRTDPTFGNFAPAILALMNHYNWKRIVFLTQDENVFNQLYTDFSELVDNLAVNETETCCFSTTDITILNRPFQTNSDPIPAIEDVFEKNGDYRVFVMNSYSFLARGVICEAARRGLVYPNYAWIMFGAYPEKWWTAEVSGDHPEHVPVNCTDEELEEFLINSRPIIIQQYPTPDDVNDTTEAGITLAEFDQLYDQRSKEENYTKTTVSGLAYDAMWSLALALNKTKEMVERNDNTETGCSNTSGRLMPLHEFNYGNEMMGCVIRWSLEQTDFTGVSGHVIFDANGTIIQNRIRLLQYRENENDNTVISPRFGYVDRTQNWALTYEATESDHTVFPDGAPPDGTPRVVIHTYNIGLVVTYPLVAGGIVLAAVCLIFNFAYRNKTVVRLTSPNLNYLIVAGALLMYSSLIDRVLPSTSKNIIHTLCIVHTWLHVTGYLLAFGTILAKMWRVYHIFHHPIPNKMAPKDWHLVMIALLVTGVGMLLVAIKSAVQYDQPILVKHKEDPEGRTDLGVREYYYVYECYDIPSPPFYCDLVIFAYLAILQLVGIILAFQTRKVKVPVLNDSKFVAALIYISSIILVILAFVTLPLGGYINIEAAIFCVGILLLATIFLALTFVPKMINLYRDPHGEKAFDKSNPTKAAGGNQDSKSVPHGISLNTNAVEGVDLIPLLLNQIREQKEAVQARERRINELEEILNASKTTSLNGGVSQLFKKTPQDAP